MLYNAKGDRLYVTTAKPGFVNVYDNSNPRQPKFLKTLPAAAGAHHSVLSPDERYLFVQNSLLKTKVKGALVGELKKHSRHLSWAREFRGSATTEIRPPR
jgi:hypothetical protein